MMRLVLTFAFIIAATLPAMAAQAQDGPMHRMDDQVMLDLSAEDWVTTKSARVMINVEAAVNASNAGSARGEMVKAVNDLMKADWRLTGFNRSEDQTGLERWSATFEARVPESQLNGLGENVKKLSRAGMQLAVGNIDFSPTLEEMEAARDALRLQIYKQANEQLVALNGAVPGRNYRVSMMDFTNEAMALAPMPHVVRGMNMMIASPAASSLSATGSATTERSEKVTLTAHIVFAASPEGKGLLPVTDVKH